ncbi:protein P54 [Clostridium pasteurianum DSM 525 = ATCC 6013]|uniref:NLP/P60 protein n=1 Tax=Clostridium pasteurianum DSM 525 = ATCC 6013 TaxID=1262449 RepID=A0A0H3J992_CLOPA|nr:C40 family peptidase [Clostridium pasteurianum]AJA48588.1 protein P54 [Clostridium pasteurianum DSM 525 = ATCC 6013]AJA52576.1 protein P54 [Clostridium pasteurianum DSM 525 = ATCC 6013]AOZ75819.1 glycoside hydrolase [Clostridium pasteurianum DSM 525 = ATCC 6013]AOZ79615.1 glycoside hydrolase [Clostridium pasteurianum]ELP57934.1 NLP/P60 protein [Clostridium pasteurianum DSM 525 = ATCC 6013]
MNRRILSVILALGIVFTANVRTLAAPSLDDQLNQSQDKYKQSQNMINEAQKKINDIEIKIEMLDNEIQKNMAEIDNTKNKIAKTEDSINNARKSIERSEQDIKAEKELYNKRMRAMYISGNSEYINILLDSKGVSDFVSKVETIKSVAKFNDKIISNLSVRRQAIQDKKDKLERDKEKLVVLKVENEKKVNELNNKKSEQQPLIAEARAQESAAIELSTSTKAQIDGIKQKIAEVKAAEARAAEQAAQQQAAAASNSNNSGNQTSSAKNITASSNNNISINRGGAVPSNSSGNSIIAYASNFLGTPYVWGGTSPNPGFDCSGFTQYVYAKFGISIGRTTYDQINDGVAVSRDQLQPGDLIFFGSWGDPHHVGMYAGNNMYIHAPRTGDVIKISPLTRSDYLTARRVK